MIKKNSIISYCFLTCILLSGLIIRLWLSEARPIWLDEQYSLFYAADPQSLKLFIESHLPTYYYIVNFILKFTNNLIVIRFLSSILPSLVGICLIIFTFLKDKSENFRSVSLLSLFLTLNPFFVVITSQARMYGFIFLFSVLLFIFLDFFLKNKNLFSFGSLFIYSFITNFFDYPIAISNFFVINYAILKLKLTKKRKSFTIFIINSFYFFQLLFTFSDVTQIKKEIEHSYSWISLPTIQNIPRILLETFGLTFNLSSSAPAIFTSYLLLGGFIFFVLKQKKQTQEKIIFLSFLPIFCILLLSLLFPFLANRIIIHKFIPNFSLFLPRILLPFSIFLYIELASILGKKTIHQFSFFILTLTIASYFLIVSSGQIKKFNIETNPTQKRVSYLQSQLNNFFSPPWLVVNAFDENSLEDISFYSQLAVQSESFEQIIVSNLQNNAEDCSYLKGKEIIFDDHQQTRVTQEYKKISNYLESCCTSTKKTSLFINYQCR